MIVRNHMLCESQLNELEKLSNDCKHADGNLVAIYKHLLGQERLISSNILYYHQHQLVGFLSNYFFYEDGCEITLMVAPAFRRQGIATHMLKEVLPLMHNQRIKTLIFSTPHQLNDAWLPALGFHYQSSEYQMQRTAKEPIITTPDEDSPQLFIRPATLADAPLICAIDSSCFPAQQPDLALHIQSLFADPHYNIFIAELAGVAIGKTHLSWQNKQVRFTDIAILPHHQGNGYGSAMLAYCINNCLAHHRSNIILDVETTNQHALKLYLRLGFVVSNAYDFWRIPIGALQQ